MVSRLFNEVIKGNLIYGISDLSNNEGKLSDEIVRTCTTSEGYLRVCQEESYSFELGRVSERSDT